ncbi:hypothetical protein EJ04DRAFT_176478 [Polyplosphaeria fusca]|uniref:Uncharacterized protein n=1 Tax=Polyplosphaeria fusca TaxID=682080 RepID=A0A9P4R007_9PLEO|nr:hypothetical protein EJ04DRAFT_176478 [Polyplosphaeria fusca]
MGIPYSREINAAFEQVTPLVAAGFKVLRTTKNISILLAVITIISAINLFLILFTLIAILYSVNPDLEEERRRIVTPLFKWLAREVSVKAFMGKLVGFVVFVGSAVVTAWLVWQKRRDDVDVEGEDADQELIEDEKNKKKGKKSKDEKDDEKK